MEGIVRNVENGAIRVLALAAKADFVDVDITERYTWTFVEVLTNVKVVFQNVVALIYDYYLEVPKIAP